MSPSPRSRTPWTSSYRIYVVDLRPMTGHWVKANLDPRAAGHLLRVRVLTWADRTAARLGLPRGDLPLHVRRAADRRDTYLIIKWGNLSKEASLVLACDESELRILDPAGPDDEPEETLPRITGPTSKLRDRRLRKIREEYRVTSALLFQASQVLTRILRQRERRQESEAAETAEASAPPYATSPSP